jgi:hypothetical protein
MMSNLFWLTDAQGSGWSRSFRRAMASRVSMIGASSAA